MLLAALASTGLARLDVKHDYRLFIGAGDPELRIADRLDGRISGGRETLALVYRPASRAIFESTSMLQLAKVADLASRFPGVAQPQSLMTARKLVRLSDAPGTGDPRDGWRAVPFIHPDGLFDDAGLARMKRDALATPTIGGRLVARDGSSALVLLPVDLGTDPTLRHTRLTALHAAVDKAQVDLAGLRAGDRLALIGAPLFDSALAQILHRDVIRLAPIALVLFFGLLFVLFRNVGHAATVLLVVFLSCVAALGTLCLLGVTVTILVCSGLLLVATLSVAEALHVVTGFTLHRLDGDPPLVAMTRALDANLWPIVTTSATTAIGEAVLLFSASPAVQDMGLVMVFGAIYAVVFTLLCVTALAPLVRSTSPALVGAAGGLFAKLADLSVRHPARMLGASAAVCLLLVPGIAFTRLYDTMPGWFQTGTAFRQGLDLLNRDYVAVESFTLATPVTDRLRAEGSNWPREGKSLRAEETLDGAIAALPGVRHVIGPTVARDTLGRRLAEAPAGTSSLALTRAQAEEAVGVAPPSPAMLESAGLATPSEPGRASYILRTVDAGTASNRDLLDLVAGVRAAAAERGPGASAGGLPVVFAALGQSNINRTAIGTLLTALSITLCLALAFRSLRLALVSLIPNLVPVLLVYGAWGWVDGEVNLAATSVLAVALGIVVDDTTHIFMKHDRLMRAGLDAATASHRTLTAVGPPILITSIVLACGFFLLGRSQFALTAQQANMIGATLLVAVMFDLTTTPAMLQLLNVRRGRTPKEALSHATLA